MKNSEILDEKYLNAMLKKHCWISSVISANVNNAYTVIVDLIHKNYHNGILRNSIDVVQYV